MPRPITTLERFCRACEACGKRGYVFGLYSTPATEGMRKPNDLRRFGSIYWRSPSTSLWNPIQVVAIALYRRKGDPLPYEEMAARDIGLPEELRRELHRTIYPYNGYNKATRKALLESCHLF